ncbi:MAG: hypothetical protein J2P28_17175, partial [Actinobacteria bacterium]|nr:hypothetical protein [Actinomycetota bacterium]
MTNQHDKIDDWLGTQVTPLSPPPGALDRIRRRARQRKMRQVAVASTGCAVVLAAAIAVPTVISGLQPAGGSHPFVGADQNAPTQGLGRLGGSGGAPGPQGSGSPRVQLRQHTKLSGSDTAPPRNFQPTSVTFVGNGSGGLVGAVIGQAGPPCFNPTDCTSLAGTSNYGKTWYGVSAPVAPGPDQATGVSQLRFANLNDGWAFGPALYETSDGGWPWKQVQVPAGQAVVALEAFGRNALAVFATCSGTGAGYANSCTSFSLYGGAAGSTSFSPVAVPAAYQHMSTTQPSAVKLVVSGTTGYLLTPGGAVLSGPVTGGAWSVAGQAPCAPQVAGSASGAQIAVGTPGQLVLTCATAGTSAAGPPTVKFYASADGAKTWQQKSSSVPVDGPPTSLTQATTGLVVLATSAGIL